jgi:hypothetical protein
MAESIELRPAEAGDAAAVFDYAATHDGQVIPVPCHRYTKPV